MKKKIIPLAIFLLSSTTYSQVGIGTPNPSSSTILDVVSDSKGILIPRVSLNSLNDDTTITSGNVNSLLVFNTASQNDVKPGYYYWYDNKWMRIINTDDVISLDSNTKNLNFEIRNDSLILNDSDGNNISISLEDLNISTEIINNNDGTYTLINEQGDEFIINIIGEVATDIQNQGVIYDEIINILQSNSDRFVDNGNGTFTHTAADGTSVTFNANTLNISSNNGIYTFRDSANNILGIIDINANQIIFNDTVTNLNATNVQDAITSLLTRIQTIEKTKGNLSGNGILINGNATEEDALFKNVSLSIADNSISSSKLVDDSVNALKINQDVAGNGLSQNSLTGALEINPTAISTLLGKNIIADDSSIVINNGTGAVLVDTNVKVADGGISTHKLADNAVTNEKLSENSVDSLNIIDETIVNQDIATKTITSDKLNATGVTAGNVATVNIDGTVSYLSPTVSSQNIINPGDLISATGDESITILNGIGTTLINTQLKVTEGGITTGKLADNSVNNSKLTNNSVNSSNIIDGSIIDQDIAAKTITSSKLDATGNTVGHVATVNADGTVSYSPVSTQSISDKKAITSTGAIKVNASNSVSNATLADVVITVDTASGTNLGVVKEAVANPTVIVASDGALNVNLSQLAGNGLIADTTNNQLNVSANNGISIDSDTDKIQLGGSLLQPTEIVTTSSNTLAIKGLQTGTTSEKILVVNETSGVVKQIEQNSVAIEPWNIQGTSNKAIENSENIYQQGNVAIGIDNSVTKSDKLYVLGEITFENEFKESSVITNDAKSSSVVNQGSSDFYANVNVKNNDEFDGRSYIHVNAGQEDTYTNAYIPEIMMTAGSGHSKSQLYGEYSINILKSNKLSGIGVHNFLAASTLNNGVENTFVSIDEKGLKIGTYDDAGANNDREIDFFGYSGASVANTYYLPKSAPLDKQVLTFESNEVSSGFSTTKTKWKNIDELISEPWNVQGGAIKATSNTENIYQMGNVAIGITDIPSTSLNSINPKLYVQGNIHVNGSLYTTNSVYADYVFEKYFNGFSEIKKDYDFPKLSQVKEFIIKNHHLPGVTPIGELKRTDDGYVIDYSKLSIEQLEKIEELYIHVINQQETIERQENLIKSQELILNEYQKRLEVLEKYLLNSND